MGTLPILVLALCFCNFVFANYRNYCNDPKVKKLCGGQQHVACGPLAQGWSSVCRDQKQVDLGTSLKKWIVHNHNWYREKVATGKGRSRRGTFPQAADMLYVDWDEELAYLASLNIKQCDMKHDQCRAVDVESGQNLGMVASSRPGPYKDSITKIIRGWYKEIKLASPSIVYNYTGRGDGEINHFGALAWGKTNRVGCALGTYKKTYDFGGKAYELETHLLACNYAPAGNWIGEPMYTVGPPCSKCPSGTCKTKYKLCKTFYKNSKKPSKRTEKPSKHRPK